MPNGAKVEGLNDFQRSLRGADPKLKTALRDVHKEIADTVVDSAHRRTSRAHIRKAITARGSQRAATVAMLGSRAPDVFGNEFGALAYKQFDAWRGNSWSDPKGLNVGYLIHPAIREHSDDINDEYLDKVERALRSDAFPD